ncbi:MAG: SpaA isopeptide-forming pilin-related protein [Culicoidibacterales bacterium]
MRKLKTIFISLFLLYFVAFSTIGQGVTTAQAANTKKVNTRSTIQEVGTLKVRVYEKDKWIPLPGARYSITNDGGQVVAIRETNLSGEIVVDNLPSGEYKVSEKYAATGYVANPEVQALEVPSGGVVIGTRISEKKETPIGHFQVKVYEKNTWKPLSGAEFEVLDATGKKIDKIVTNEQGEANKRNLPCGDYTINEIKAPAGYTLNPEKQSIHVVRYGLSLVSRFSQKEPLSIGQLFINTYDRKTEMPISGVVLEVSDQKGKTLNVVTDEDGKAVVNLTAGTYRVTEKEEAEGYISNMFPKYVTVYPNQGSQVAFFEEELVQAPGTGRVEAFDKETKKPIMGVEFTILNETGEQVATMITDESGVAEMELPPGDYQAQQTKVPGEYIVNSEVSTLVIVRYGLSVATRLNVKEAPAMGSIKIKAQDKISGRALEGVEFSVLNDDGKAIATVITTSKGEAIAQNIPVGEYQIKEMSAAQKYVENPEMHIVTVEENRVKEVVHTSQKTPPVLGKLMVMSHREGSSLSIRDAKVTVMNENGKVVAKLITNFIGEASIDLPAGKYKVLQTAVPQEYKLNTDTKFATVVVKEETIVQINNEKK